MLAIKKLPYLLYFEICSESIKQQKWGFGCTLAMFLVSSTWGLGVGGWSSHCSKGWGFFLFAKKYGPRWWGNYWNSVYILFRTIHTYNQGWGRSLQFSFSFQFSFSLFVFFLVLVLVCLFFLVFFLCGRVYFGWCIIKQ